MPDNAEKILTDMLKDPKSATIDGVRVEQHSLKDIVEADRYLKEQAAVDPFACIGHRQVRFGGPK